MDIYVKSYGKPNEEKRTFQSPEIYQKMEELDISVYYYGITVHCNDYNWHNGDGNGGIVHVYNNYPEAHKHWVVRPRHPDDDPEECYSTRAVKIIVQKGKLPQTIVLNWEQCDEPFLDIISVEGIFNLTPIPVPESAIEMIWTTNKSDKKGETKSGKRSGKIKKRHQ